MRYNPLSDLQTMGQRFFIGFEGKNPQDPGVIEIIKLAGSKLIGGVVLFTHNIESSAQLIHLTTALKSKAPDLVIAVDQEGGMVQRLSAQNGFMDFKSAYEVAEMQEVEAHFHYLSMAKMLSDHGINLNFAPCVDLHDRLCPIIGKYKRSYGSTAATINKYAKIFIDAHNQYNISTCLKHFPGHGYSTADSHKGLVDITAYADPKKELKPFKDLANHVNYVMTAHVINQNIDWLPATLSQKYIKPILKDEIGFKGKVVTDDIVMGAILDSFSITKACKMAIAAGCDNIILSFHPMAMGKTRLPDNFSYLNLLKKLMDYSPDVEL